MELRTVLIWILIISVLLCIGLWAASRRISSLESVTDSSQSIAAYVRKHITAFLLRSYAIFLKVPPLRYYVRKVRGKLSLMHTYAEFELRRRTMMLVYALLLTFGLGITLLTWMNPNIMFFVTLLITAAVLQGLFLDGFVNRLERKLLEHMLEFFAAVRHAYHRHGMITDAIDEAAEGLGEEIGAQAYRIHEALTAPKQQEALEQYYETAPSRFLKAFAGISSLVMEFGDKTSKEGSVFLRAVASLTQEIQLDLIRRTKLDYLLKGLHVIALAPIFFTKPIEMWARRNFPLMDHFYLSKAGIVLKILIFLIILISYILLQKLKNEEDTAYRASGSKICWEARIYKIRWVRSTVQWFVPPRSSFSYYRLTQLFKDSNLQMRVEWFQLRRVGLFLVGFISTIALCIALHVVTYQQILREPPQSTIFFGAMTPQEKEGAERLAALEKKAMEKMNTSQAGYDAVLKSAEAALEAQEQTLSQDELTAMAVRIVDKLNRLDREYLKWWEVAAALAAGCLAFALPLWLLWFQRKMRLSDMLQEVYQFMTMVGIFKELERISVEEILEWLYVYAVIFKAPLEKCLLNYSQGGETALQEMKAEVALTEFRRFVDKLLLAAEKITIAKAFDDLEHEMSFQFERRRFDYEKSLDTRAELGRMIGFTPMYSLVFAYLVIPLIWMSFKQMDLYFEHIQKL
ncbi:hypothetical protein MKX50_13580 [Paenibacillus sp. FSL W8-0186]|uniref:hypothetical protein n=1 Tax=Paenibacillus sp. FSL W8-0186 TaxID=2921709 RepID=UPI0030D2BCEE